MVAGSSCYMSSKQCLQWLLLPMVKACMDTPSVAIAAAPAAGEMNEH
jgi:hypothetical protein